MIDPEDIKPFADLMPDLQSVTYHPRSGGGFGSSVSVSKSEKRWVTTREMASGNAKISGADVVWHVWSDEVATPREGDKIVDAEGVTWMVKYVSTELLGTRHRLYCAKGR